MDFGTALKNPLDSQLSFSSSGTRNAPDNERDPLTQSPNSLPSSASLSRSLDLRDPYLPEDDGSILTPEHAFVQYQTRSEDQACQICGQPAVGFHHRAYVCEACKKFFMRHTAARFRNRDETGSIAAESVCPMGGQCRVEGPGRGKCPHCRYRKCLDLGMTLTPPGGEGGCDISQIPCRVCGGPSSGFHFGALTCEGCKGFFRRTVLSNVRLECLSNNDCPITPANRNMCKSCRFQRCLAVGMSKTGSRIGRQPNAIKYYCAREISQLNSGPSGATTTTGSNGDSESPVACATTPAPSRNPSGNRGATPAPVPTNSTNRALGHQWITTSSGASPEPDELGGLRSPPSCCSTSSAPMHHGYQLLTPHSAPTFDHNRQQQQQQQHQHNGRSSSVVSTPLDGRRASCSALSPQPASCSSSMSSLPPPLAGSPFDHTGQQAMLAAAAAIKANSKKRRSLSDRPPSSSCGSLVAPPPPAYFDSNGQHHLIPLHLTGEAQHQHQPPTSDRLKYASTSSTCSSASSSPSCSRGDFVVGRHPTPPVNHQQPHHHRPWYGTGPTNPVASHASDGAPLMVMMTANHGGARETPDYNNSTNRGDNNNGVATVALLSPSARHQYRVPHSSATLLPYAVSDDYAEADDEGGLRQPMDENHRRRVQYPHRSDSDESVQHQFFYSGNATPYRTSAPAGASLPLSPSHMLAEPSPSSEVLEAAVQRNADSLGGNGGDVESSSNRPRSTRSIADNLTSTVLQFHQQQQLPHQHRLVSPGANSVCQLEQIPSDSEFDCSTLTVFEEPLDPSGTGTYYRNSPRQGRHTGVDDTTNNSGKVKFDNCSNSPGPLSPPLQPQQHQQQAPRPRQSSSAAGTTHTASPQTSAPYWSQQQQSSAAAVTTRLPSGFSYCGTTYPSRSSSRGDPKLSPSSNWQHQSSGYLSRSRPSGDPGASFRSPGSGKYDSPPSPVNRLRSSSPSMHNKSTCLPLVSTVSAGTELCTVSEETQAPWFAAAAAAAAVAMVASQASSSSNSPADAVAAAMDAASAYTMASGLVRSCEAAAVGGMVAAAVNRRALSTTTCFAKRLKVSADDEDDSVSPTPPESHRHSLTAAQQKTANVTGCCRGAIAPQASSAASSSTTTSTMTAMRVAAATAAAATAAGLVFLNRRNAYSEEQRHRSSSTTDGNAGAPAVSTANPGSLPSASVCMSIQDEVFNPIYVTVAEFAEGIRKAASYMISERKKPSSSLPQPGPPMHTLERVEEVWDRMMQNFELHSRFVVHFAKLLPGFNNIALDDKRQLVRGAMYPLMLLKLSQDYVNKTDSKYNYFDFTEDEREVILKHFPTFHTITNHLIRSGEFLDRIRLDNIELALAGAQEVFKNREHLIDPVSIEHLYELAVHVLRDHIATSGHVVQDRLTSFTRLSPLLEELNAEHHRILAQLKHDMPQLIFPELYTEMFYLTEDEQREQRLAVFQTAAAEAAAAVVAETLQ